MITGTRHWPILSLFVLSFSTCNCGSTPCQDDEACRADEYCQIFQAECVERETAGAACNRNRQCATPTVCNSILGTCSAGASGERCGRREDCAEDLLCASSLLCSAGALGDDCTYEGDCTAPLVCGSGSCSDGQAGRPCDGDHQCATPLICSNKTKECTDGSLGTECSLEHDCAAPLHCNSTFTPDQCSPGDVGDPCRYDFECDEPYVCSLSGKCIKGTLDTVCYSYHDCLAPLICNAAYHPAVCKPPSKNGEPCFNDIDCASYANGVVCNYAFNPPECRPLGNDGDPCAENLDCVPGLLCSGPNLGSLVCQNGG